MANEISFSNLEADAGLAHVLSGDIHADLFDPTDLRGTCTRRNMRGGMGSETIKVPRFNPAHTFTAATSELVGGGSNEDIGSANFQLTAARRYMRWQLSALWDMIAPSGSLDMDLLRLLIVQGTGLTFTDMLTALFPSLSGSVGSTTAQMSVEYMLDGQYALNSSRAPAPYTMVLSPHGFNRWQESLIGFAGPSQFKEAAQEMIDAMGPGFKGTYGGINVYDSDSVSLDGGSTYRRGAIYAPGCFSYSELPVSAMRGFLPPSRVAIVDGLVRIVLEYDADNALGLMVGDYYPAVSEAEDARGRVINHLAA